MTDKSQEARLRRLRMRASRRGIREMDLILGRYADARLSMLDESRLAQFDALLHENDQDLYLWVTGQAEPPARLASLIGDIAAEFGTGCAASSQT